MGKRKNKPHFNMSENLRLAVYKQIEEFICDEERVSLEFPPSFSKSERAYVHHYALEKDLTSRSTGKGKKRFLTLYKRNSFVVLSYDATFTLNSSTENSINQLLTTNPVTPQELQILSNEKVLMDNAVPFKFTLGNFVRKNLRVPPKKRSDKFLSFRQTLPIYSYKDSILKTIEENQVTVISGDTGSGKTTQVPQFILEQYCEQKKICRIVCTQPRRLAAISISSRVAEERGENLGAEIGYQIRLESRMCPSTNLIYTTSGFLLRCLLGGSTVEVLSTVTHIILDEVHERDKFTEFLLIVLKENLQLNPNLKIILMSATIESTEFTNYFNNCPLVEIPGRMFHVDIYYLETILNRIDYENPQMVGKKNTLKKTLEIELEAITTEKNAQSEKSVAQEPCNLDEDTVKLVNDTLEECWFDKTKSAFSQFFYLVTGENIPVDIKHTDTQMTALMIAAARNHPDIIEILLELNANPMVIGACEKNALEWAIELNNEECIKILTPYSEYDRIEKNANINKIIEKENLIRQTYELDLSKLYQSSVNEHKIDHLLLFNLIKYIHLNMNDNGSILVFLPGYDDIVEQNEFILEDEFMQNSIIYMLHSNMKSNEQQNIFKPSQYGTRKIILATNIAETSLTIDDVIYVIDCGKVKQKAFDAISGTTSLTSTWISQACAKQRCGRAGRTRTGICFRLYTHRCFDEFSPYTLPEILRIPLTEICLNAKILANENLSIIEFLTKAMQPPTIISIKHSINLLQKIGALDNNENVTRLGAHLVDLPMDVQYGKALIYAILLKCIDPVLTIVSGLSVKDIFILSGSDENDNVIDEIRKTFSEESFSDHMVMLRIFQKWNECKAKRREKEFCRKNSINNGVMELICGGRSQILAYLRSAGFIKPRGDGNIHDLNVNSNSWSTVKACLTAGLYPNFCRIDQTDGKLKSRLATRLKAHPSSVLCARGVKDFGKYLLELPTEWIIYGEKSRVNRTCSIRYNTIVSPLCIALFSGPIHLPETCLVDLNNKSKHMKFTNNDNDDNDNEGNNDKNNRIVEIDEVEEANDDDYEEFDDYLQKQYDEDDILNGEEDEYDDDDDFKVEDGCYDSDNENENNRIGKTKLIIDDWIYFVLNKNTAKTIYQLRQKLNVIFFRLINNPNKFRLSTNDELVLRTVLNSLKNADIDNKLPEPKNVGLRPLAVNLQFSSNLNYGVVDNITTNETTITTTTAAAAASLTTSATAITSTVRSISRNSEKQQYSTVYEGETRHYIFNKKTTNAIPSTSSASSPKTLNKSTRITAKNSMSTSNCASPSKGRVNKFKNISDNRRYFFMKVSSMQDITNISNGIPFPFTFKVLSTLLFLKRKTIFEEFVLLFYLYREKCFVGYGTFQVLDDKHYVSVHNIHNIPDHLTSSLCTGFKGSAMKPINDCFDGEEIDPQIGRILIDLCLQRD